MKKKLADENIMRKIQCCTLLLCTALVCASCGSNASETPGADVTEDTTQNSSQQTADDTTADNTESPDTGNSQDVTPDSASDDGSAENDTSVSSTKSHITIEMKSDEDNKSDEDGTVYLSRSITYPVVTIDGNNDASDKINADIRSKVDAFNGSNEIEEMAKENLEYFESEESDYPFLSYDENMTFRTTRSDSNVISFTADYYAFTGDAHGNGMTQGLNYNAKTGELISFSDLSDDPTAFHEDTLAYNRKLAQTESYKERMFSEESISDGTLESVLYADDSWYLSTSGLVFMSPPYALGPYAEGTIEFIIPYSDLADMGFKNIYTYSDKFVLKLQNNETYNYDLNGDGADDSVLLYSEYVENSDGAYDMAAYVIINDTNFATEGDTATKEQIAQCYVTWAEPALYDLNPDDSYVELMLVSGENEGDDYVYYSHFFRYEEDGSLAYLGKAKGDALDPTVDTSELTVSIAD